MKRHDAKLIIAKDQLSKLSEKQKIEILEEYWWSYDNESEVKEAIQDGILPELSKQIIVSIANFEEPELFGEETDEIILDHLVFSLDKVVNTYLSQKLKDLGIESKVQGTLEPAGLCPCCDYYSIDQGEDGYCDICPVCFWENGGEGPNHMSLNEARKNFKIYGAMDKGSLKFVDLEGQKKYKKKDSNPNI